MSVVQPCAKCGAETKHKKDCPQCHTPVVYVPPTKTPKPKAELEMSIKQRIRRAVIDAGCLCWVHNVDNRSLHTGLGLGTADLVCVVPPRGVFVGIEIKRPGYAPSRVKDNQRQWLAVVRQFGGVTGIATNVEEALAIIQEARER